jgi:hypothetical protein
VYDELDHPTTWSVRSATFHAGHGVGADQRAGPMPAITLSTAAAAAWRGSRRDAGTGYLRTVAGDDSLCVRDPVSALARAAQE